MSGSERSKHPCRSDRLLPIVAPENPELYATDQIKQVPTPRSSRSNGPLPEGTTKILFLSSVIMKPVLLPIGFVVNTTSNGSGLPSTQIEVLLV